MDNHAVLKNSQHMLPPSAKAMRRTSTSCCIELTFGVKRKKDLLGLDALDHMRPGERKYMTREKLAFVAKHNLLVTCSDPGSAPLRDIVSGNNDTDALLNSKYQAGPGWDACTGWGAPDEVKLLKALQTPAA